jgi:hypothetical protein
LHCSVEIRERCYTDNRVRTAVCSLAQERSIDNAWGYSMSIELHAFDMPNGRRISVALEEMALH